MGMGDGPPNGWVDPFPPVYCPTSEVSRMLGKSGRMIKEIARKSGCKFIRIVHEDVVEGKGHPVTFFGTHEEMESARAYFFDVLGSGISTKDLAQNPLSDKPGEPGGKPGSSAGGSEAGEVPPHASGSDAVAKSSSGAPAKPNWANIAAGKAKPPPPPPSSMVDSNGGEAASAVEAA